MGGKLVWKREGGWDGAWRWSGFAFYIDANITLATVRTVTKMLHVGSTLNRQSQDNVSTDLIHPTHAQQRTRAQEVHAATHTYTC